MCHTLIMSGESGRHSRPVVGQQVRPEPVVEKTFVENVAGFINEVSHATLTCLAKEILVIQPFAVQIIAN
ncbi:hypothetical protein E2C01_034420 [Portunus trituberculatus]|uniref:Uncharacterized protein n=1 Tax=Portunus trituberculatus TaxID=210409 RepID=A0A5B7F5S8_PORTR|nr:hypothetical protein [Portunus trituberculatus]